ncbi:hypothetical protein EMMF5_003935 [Cystobasidiomycetes sp. EMM_F5]
MSGRYFAASSGLASTSKRVIEDDLDDANENNEAEKDDEEEEEEEEEDFMSDKFLLAAKETDAKTKRLSYSEKRRAAIRRGEEKGIIKSRAVREREAREEGLRTSLLMAPSHTTTSSSNATPPSGGGNKALDMMMKMGFKPGQALGKQINGSSLNTATQHDAVESQHDTEEEEDGFISLSGIGSKKRASSDNPSAASSKRTNDDRRIDPLEIKMRTGRAGFGVEENKRRKLAETVQQASSKASESIDDYRTRVQSNHLEKRAEGQLVSARKTCKELDEGKGINSNYLWLDPKEEEYRRRAILLGSSTSRYGNMQRPDSRLGDFGGDAVQADEDNVYGDDQSRRGAGDGRIDIELEDEAFEDDELDQREDDKLAFLQMDARTRLKETYGSQAEMENECPGEDEEDH